MTSDPRTARAIRDAQKMNDMIAQLGQCTGAEAHVRQQANGPEIVVTVTFENGKVLTAQPVGYDAVGPCPGGRGGT
jgi:hypothetical protein